MIYNMLLVKEVNCRQRLMNIHKSTWVPTFINRPDLKPLSRLNSCEPRVERARTWEPLRARVYLPKKSSGTSGWISRIPASHA